MKMKTDLERTLFRSPLSLGYWKAAAGEVKNLRALLLAALIVAIRVALKRAYIPVGDHLNVSIGFLFTAVGGTVYGPILGFLAGIVSDLLGFVVAPNGSFNPVYTLIEALSGGLYALLLYRQRVTFLRLMATKASVNLVINILCNSIANGLIVGRGVYYYMIPSILKNTVLLPFEVLLLSVVFGALMHPLVSLKLLSPEQNALKMRKSSYILLGIVMVAVLAGGILVAINYPEVKAAFKGFFDALFGKAK